MSEALEDRLPIEELRYEARRGWDREHALITALRDLPEVPPVPVLHLLSGAGKFKEDWEAGKALQRKHGLDAVPPKTEYEMGAGVWARIRTGLLNGQSGRDGEK